MRDNPMKKKTKAVIRFTDPLPKDAVYVPSEKLESFEIELEYEGTPEDFQEWTRNIEKIVQAKSIDNSYAEYVKDFLSKENS